MKILITGGTGLIGQEFVREALARNHEICILSRNPARNPHQNLRVKVIGWDGRNQGNWTKELQETEAIIHLAGENIGEKRWSPERLRIIRQSRLETGLALVEGIRSNPGKIKIFLQASAVGIYGNGGEVELDETSAVGTDPLARLCVDWENSTSEVENSGIQRGVMRIGLVLTSKGGALGKLLLPYRAFLGGPLGNGKQWWPWIHYRDLTKAILFLLEKKDIGGVYNLCGPQPARMADVGKALATALHRPYWFPVPALALRILLGKMSQIVLDGQQVKPTRLSQAGFQFQYPDLNQAMKDLFTP